MRTAFQWDRPDRPRWPQARRAWRRKCRPFLYLAPENKALYERLRNARSSSRNHGYARLPSCASAATTLLVVPKSNADNSLHVDPCGRGKASTLNPANLARPKHPAASARRQKPIIFSGAKAKTTKINYSNLVGSLAFYGKRNKSCQAIFFRDVVSCVLKTHFFLKKTAKY